MARLPFVDTHVHFHDLANPSLRYGWLEADAPSDEVVGPDRAIRAQRYWADDFLAETRFQNVAKIVHVEVAVDGDCDPVEETRWIQAFADRLGYPHGIVARVDLAQPDAAEQIERHRAFANFRGVRDQRGDDYLANPQWRKGFAALEGLVFCDAPFVAEMGEARRLAEQHPGVTLCVDHAAYPGTGGKPRTPAQADFASWRAGMRQLAAAESAVVKISGLGMSDHAWTAESIRPWVLECIDAFGVERSFFATNWPLDRLYSSYGDVLDAYAEIVADFTEAEQLALFAGNAERIFRLGGDGDGGGGDGGDDDGRDGNGGDDREGA
ncbi:MAG TPA: amidohydrolase family protein [Conexibacter sp.]|nr:amidohydrolase family protein [Conexibacter sp.]